VEEDSSSDQDFSNVARREPASFMTPPIASSSESKKYVLTTFAVALELLDEFVSCDNMY
jgi:hypothetical protein